MEIGGSGDGDGGRWGVHEGGKRVPENLRNISRVIVESSLYYFSFVSETNVARLRAGSFETTLTSSTKNHLID